MQHDIGQSVSVEEVIARSAIQEILHAHSRGIDRLDQGCIEACYWPDAEVAYGSFEGEAQQFAALVIPALASQYELTQHRVTNTLISFASPRPKSESYVSAYHLLKGGEEELFFSGRYLDIHEVRNNRWKMIHRRVVMDWSRRLEVVDERRADGFAGLAKGAHLDRDPLFDFLNQN